MHRAGEMRDWISTRRDFKEQAETLANLARLGRSLKDRCKRVKNVLFNNYLETPGILQLSEDVGLGWLEFSNVDPIEVTDPDHDIGFIIYSTRKGLVHARRELNHNKIADPEYFYRILHASNNNLGIVLLPDGAQQQEELVQGQVVTRPTSSLLVEDIVEIFGAPLEEFPGVTDLLNLSTEDLLKEAHLFFKEIEDIDLSSPENWELFIRLVRYTYAVVIRSMYISERILQDYKKNVPYIVAVEGGGTLFRVYDISNQMVRYYWTEADPEVIELISAHYYTPRPDRSFVDSLPTIMQLERSINEFKKSLTDTDVNTIYAES